MNTPQCTRCGATSADRAYVGFTSNPAETYCLPCLTPEQMQMLTALIEDSQPIGDDTA